MDNKIEVLIKKSLEHFDKQNYDNSKLISQRVDFRSEDTIELNKSRVSHIVEILESKYYFEQLAIFDVQTKTWIWSWSIPIIFKELVNESKYLLNYGLSLEPKINQEDFYYLKVLLTNSRIKIDDDIQLDILLSICSYLLGNRIKFIYKKSKLNKDGKNIIFFYLVKIF